MRAEGLGSHPWTPFGLRVAASSPRPASPPGAARVDRIARAVGAGRTACGRSSPPTLTSIEAWRPAWCTPCESGPVAGAAPACGAARARMAAQCSRSPRALERSWVLQDTNDSKRAPPMLNAPSPKRRPRSGKDPGSTTSPSPSTRSVKDSHACTKHPVHAGARRSAWERMPSPFMRTGRRARRARSSSLRTSCGLYESKPRLRASSTLAVADTMDSSPRQVRIR
jgi:hypothetical protein